MWVKQSRRTHRAAARISLKRDSDGPANPVNREHAKLRFVSGLSTTNATSISLVSSQESQRSLRSRRTRRKAPERSAGRRSSRCPARVMDPKSEFAGALKSRNEPEDSEARTGGTRSFHAVTSAAPVGDTRRTESLLAEDERDRPRRGRVVGLLKDGARVGGLKVASFRLGVERRLVAAAPPDRGPEGYSLPVIQ